ncbi:MAG: uracil phosphoribosyltransferase, partial [Bacteroidia bacterium]|nr:uracil phosphoribosyltransferase [Bacteroidia bacterium]
ILHQFLSEIRDSKIQQDPLRFRRNMERIGEIMGYELSKTLEYSISETTTPLGVAQTSHISDQIVLATILRAGLPLHTGLLNYFDRAQNAFVSAYRRNHKDNTFDIQIEYLSCPDITDKVLVISDPMLATGSSMVLAYQALLKRGIPKHTHIISAIASRQGVDYCKKNLPPNVSIWLAAVDEELTAHAYIVPGLGDAGDLAYGEKI